jgi:hypothetical protein
MALNVPMANDVQVNVPSLSDAVGKWTQINSMQQRQELAKNEEARAVDTTERANKMNDLKFGGEQRAAHKEIMTDFKTVLQKKAQMSGIQPNTPQYQQLANATYSTGYDKLMQNTGAPPHDPNTDIDLGAVEALTTAQEAHAMEMEQETAKQNAMLQRQMQLGQFNNQFAEKSDQRNYEQSLGLEGVKHGHDLETMQLKNEWDNQKLDLPKPMSEYQQASLDMKQQGLETKQDAKKLATQGQLATFDTMLDTLDRVKTHKGLDKSVGLKAYLPSVKGTDAYDFEQSLETLKSQAFVPMVASLKGMGALSDAEGKKLTQAVGELEVGMSKDEFVKSVDRINKDISAAKRRIEASSGVSLAGEQQQTATPQDIPAGYKMQRNKRTGETRLVKAE